MGRAISEILAAELSAPGATAVIPAAGVRSAAAALGARPAKAPGISAEREAAMAAGANRLIACQFSVSGNQVHVSAVEEDTASQKNVRRATADGGLLAASDSLAKQLSVQTVPYATKNEAAVRAYAEALEATDADSERQDFSRAVAADENFAPAYLSWLQAEAARQDRQGMEHALTLAEAHSKAFSEYDRARVALIAADFHGDVPGRARALAVLAKTGPPDAGVYRSLADIALAGRRYRDAINYYRQAVAIAPGEVLLLNSLGYAEAYLGDYDAAMRTLREYQRLRPNEANPIDSQGDVNFYFNRFGDAEKSYLAAYQKGPNFLNGGDLWKAAQARLATGDLQGAEQIFARYAAVLDQRHDPGAGYQKATWQYLTGRRREGVAMLEAEAKGTGGLASILHAQLAIWRLQLGDRAKAALDAQAAATAAGKQMSALVVIAQLLSMPENAASSAEWQARSRFLPPAEREIFNAYALLFHRRFGDAVPPLRHAWEESNPSTEQGLPVLLGWAMIEAEKWDGVTALLGPAPVPASGINPLVSLYFRVSSIFADDWRSTRASGTRRWRIIACS